MSARKRLVPDAELRRALDTLKEYGLDLRRCAIDIRADGVAITPPGEAPANAFDQWKNTRA